MEKTHGLARHRIEIGGQLRLPTGVRPVGDGEK
jgi:hypothetical protein